MASPAGPALAGEVALVTGGSRGIGCAAAVELARLGADVGLLQRGEATETVAAIGALGRRTHVVRVDLADPEAAGRAVDEVAAALGRIDVLVAAAGEIQRTPALELSLESFRRVLEVNLTSSFALARAAGRRFVADGRRGRIVLVGSVLSFQGGINVAAYAASKGGLAQLAKALANEWAPLGIRVNVVAPGYVETDLTKELRANPTRFAELSARIPAGRWATPEEIAGAIAFLVSPGAEYIHGHVLAVDGGWLAR
jgi:2-deoxy-D-gluconate 3-dehydrogenase